MTKEEIKSRIKISANGCWIGINRPNDQGYVYVQINGKHHKLHRLSYVAFKGEIPKGMELDHLCRNRNCANPEHLEAVTHTENLNRSPVQKGKKQYCKRGHILTNNNIYYYICRGYRCRMCIKCNNLRKAKVL
jgi:hypothetical protein